MRESKKMMVEEQNSPPKQLREYFTPAIYDWPTRTHMSTIPGPFENKPYIIQMLPSFLG